MEKSAKIFIAGHAGLAGSAILRALQKEGYENLILKTRAEIDLLDQRAVDTFFQSEKPEYVFLAAALVGGIMANKERPADFIYQNIQIEANILESARKANVKKLLFLGSSCVYPKLSPQPIKEESFMTGALEPTNEAYAAAKIAGIIMCQSYNRQYGTNFVSVMPTNLYGPNDNFDLESSHVLPAFLRKFHDAKERGDREVKLWGSGAPRREFLHADDLAQACLFIMEKYDDSGIINIGMGEDISIKELADIVKAVIGYDGAISWDASKPDGTPRKLLDVSKLSALGWKYSIPLKDGIADTYRWFLENYRQSN